MNSRTVGGRQWAVGGDSRTVGGRQWAVGGVVLALLAGTGSLAGAQQQTDWPVHSMERPRPPIVAPASAATSIAPSALPPADAIVLFNGSSLAGWEHGNGNAPRWKIEDGYFEVVRGTGAIRTKELFGDVQLHVEWMSPDPPRGSGQNRGNSGVFLMGRYEIQILDSHDNETYADGQAGSIYGQFPPAVNASRAPGEWQSYDIVFRAPRFSSDGTLLAPARLTVLYNGVLIHDNVELKGATAHMRPASYEAHEAQLPISLQDHGDPVRFRNIWVRKIN